MTNNIQVLRKCAMDLQATPNEEVVKVAGILSRIKNFFKWLVNSDYRHAVKSFKQNTNSLKDSLDELKKATSELDDAINNGELDTYKEALEKVKNLSIVVYKDLRQIKLNSGEITEGLWNYTREQMKNDPEFRIKFESQLPPEYSIELYENYNVPLKSLDWFKNVSPSMIYIKSDDDSALTAFIKKCKEELGRANPELPKILDQDSNVRILVQNFKEAIVNGLFIRAEPHEPSATHTGSGPQTQNYIKSEPFAVPETDIKLSAGVWLIDQRTSHSPDNILSLKRTHYVRSYPSIRASQFHQFIKSAFVKNPDQLFETKLSELELANVMKQGYQNAFGELPSLEALAFGWSQAALESGRRPTVLKNNNIGNLIAPESWVNKGNSYFTMNHQQVDSEGKTYDVPGQKMMSFKSPVDGATEYWKLLGRKFGHAMPWITGGDPTSAAVALGLGTYYTADIQRYSNTVTSLYKTFMKELAPQFQDLKSGAKQLEKLQVKNRKDYSKEEIEKIKSNKNETDHLYDAVASNNNLTSLINKRVLKDLLPTSKVLVSFITNANKDEQIFYAYETANIIRKFADAEVSIHSGNNQIELEVSTLGQPYTVCAAVQALCDCMTDQFLKQTGLRIDAVSAYNFNSKYAKITQKELNSNLRISKIKKLANKVL